MSRSLLAGIVFLGNFSIQYAYSQATGRLPSAEAVLDRFVAVSGGQASYDRVQNDVRKMTVQASGTTAVERVTYQLGPATCVRSLTPAAGRPRLE
jgi:hypothetical protein